MTSSTQTVISPRAIGITVLHEGAPSTVDVICVHGLNSTPSQCWQKGIVLWPRDLLPGEINDTRIATFGYNSSVLEDASTAKIRDHARDLLQDLLDNRKGQVAQRPIIFVCHSLGGIVVKQALVMAHAQPKFESIKNTTYGIVFLGTPHRGSDLASLAETVAKIAGVAFGKRKAQTQLLKTLRENSQQLQDLNEEFTVLHSLYKIVTCFEQKKTAFSKGLFSKTEIVVPESSAKLAIEGETLVAMNTDHRNICKFNSRDDSQYIKVKNRIAELANMAPDAIKARLKPAAGAVLSSVTLNQISEFLFSTVSSRARNFVGREVELKELHDYFGKQCAEQRIAVLWGLGGMGKTQLALKYQERHQQKYNSVFWITCTSEDTIIRSFQDIAQNLVSSINRLFPDVSVDVIARGLGIRNASSLDANLTTLKDPKAVGLINVVKSFLGRQVNKDWFLVFDSWDLLAEVDLRTYFPPSSHGHIIITTREKDFGGLGFSLGVSGVGPDTGARILLDRISPAVAHLLAHDAEDHPDFQEAKTLSAELGGVPLALEQAEAYILHNPMRFRDYLTLYNKNPSLLDHLPTSSEWAYEKNKTVFRTLRITCSALTPIARDLLSFLAFLDPSHITHNILERLGSSEDAPQALPSQIDGRLASIRLLIADEIGFGQAIACLSRFCLVTKLMMSKTNTWRLDIHPLVHQWSRFSLGEHQQGVAIFVASSLALVVKGIEEKEKKGKATGNSGWVSTSVLLPHVNFSMRQLPTETPLPALFEATQFIAEKFAWFYWKGKHLTEAAQLYEQVLGGMQISENIMGKGKLQLSKISESFGRVLWELGELDRAEAHVKHALDSKAEILGWQDDSVFKTAEILREIKEKNRTITAMEQRLRNAVSVAKIVPGARIDELEAGMATEEWHFYQTVEDSIELLGSGSNETINAILRLGSHRHPGRSPYSQGNALHIAAELALKDVLQILLDRGVEVNAQGGHYGNALQAAAFNDHQTVVQLLLDSGAEVNAQGGEYGSALQAAAFNGHQTVVQLLLDSGAEVNAQSGVLGTALQAAAYGGHQTVVQLLLDSGAEVNAQSGVLGTTLQAAAYGGHQTVVQLLLDSGAEVNAQGGEYGSALQAAAFNGHQTVVQLLLDSGAEVNAQSGVLGTALQAAAYGGHQTVVQLLLDSGAEVNAQSGVLGTTLQAAAYGGHQTVVQLLLDSGAEVNAQGGEYGSALQAAAFNGHQTVVQLLLDSGAEVNAQSGYYGGALQAAALNGYQAVVQLLLDSGAEVNAQSGYYGGALQAAAFNGHQTVVQLLLDSGAEVNVQGGVLGTALQAAACNGHQTVVQLLLDSGAEVNAQGGELGTALQAAAHGGHQAVVQLLLNSEAEVNAQSGYYGGALQAAALNGYQAVVQLLLGSGAKVNTQGGVLGTALQVAACNGHQAVVQLLLDSGADAQDGNALEAAVRNDHQTVVQLLLDRGAEVNAQSGQYGSALQAAEYGGDAAIIQILLNEEAEQKVQCGVLGNALEVASNAGVSAIGETNTPAEGSNEWDNIFRVD